MVVNLPQKTKKMPKKFLKSKIWNFLLKSSIKKSVLNVIKCTLGNFGVVIFLAKADLFGYSGP